MIITNIVVFKYFMKEVRNMEKKHKMLIFTVSILLILGITTYNIVISSEAKSKNQRVASESLKDMGENQNNNEDLNLNNMKNNNIKEREFKGDLKYNDKSIPVLMYHSIDYEKGNELRVPKEAFREQMSYLKQKGYTTLTLEELYDFFINNKPVPEKSIVITFDDGYKDNFENAYPILKEFGLNATIFVITSTVDTDKNYLTSKQVKELEANGIDIESHTINHEQLDKLTYSQQITTFKNSKEYVEKVLGKTKKYVAYPFGKWNNDTIKAVKDAGYSMAFTTVSGWADKSQDIYELHRIYISANYSMKEFERRVTNANYNTSDNKTNSNN